MVRFACCLLSGDPGEFPEEVGRGVSEVIKKDSNQIHSRYWFKRINGYNCPYDCLAANESLPEGMLGFVLGVPHSIGDYITFEIPFSKLTGLDGELFGE